MVVEAKMNPAVCFTPARAKVLLPPFLLLTGDQEEIRVYVKFSVHLSSSVVLPRKPESLA